MRFFFACHYANNSIGVAQQNIDIHAFLRISCQYTYGAGGGYEEKDIDRMDGIFLLPLPRRAFKKVTDWGKLNILNGPPKHTTYHE